MHVCKRKVYSNYKLTIISLSLAIQLQGNGPAQASNGQGSGNHATTTATVSATDSASVAQAQAVSVSAEPRSTGKALFLRSKGPISVKNNFGLRVVYIHENVDS